jgi:YHS domain-containing protein
MKRFNKAMSIILVAMVSLNAGDKDKKKHEVTCVVSGETIDETEYSNYKKGKVYFCCGGCKADFDEASATFAVAANYQLVATGQYMQTNCPVSGRGLNPKKVVKVANADVTFCCGNCQGKTNKAEDKMAFIFTDVSFDKGFSPVPEKPESNKNTNKAKK